MQDSYHWASIPRLLVPLSPDTSPSAPSTLILRRKSSARAWPAWVRSVGARRRRPGRHNPAASPAHSTCANRFCVYTSSQVRSVIVCRRRKNAGARRWSSTEPVGHVRGPTARKAAGSAGGPARRLRDLGALGGDCLWRAWHSGRADAPGHRLRPAVHDGARLILRWGLGGGPDFWRGKRARARRRYPDAPDAAHGLVAVGDRPYPRRAQQPVQRVHRRARRYAGDRLCARAGEAAIPLGRGTSSGGVGVQSSPGRPAFVFAALATIYRARLLMQVQECLHDPWVEMGPGFGPDVVQRALLLPGRLVETL